MHKPSLFIVLLLFCALLTCCAAPATPAQSPTPVPSPTLTPVPALPTPTPLILNADYIADPFGWISARVQDDTIPQPILSSKEIQALNQLAYPIFCLPRYYYPNELTSDECTEVLSMYFYMYSTTRYPVITLEDEDGWEKEYLAPADAASMIHDMLGVYVDNFREEEDAETWEYYLPYLDNGLLYIPEHDGYDCMVYLRNYQYLGDDIFYVSFDGNDDNIADPAPSKSGMYPDYRRLLVKRADTEWGFTVIALLSERSFDSTLHSLLPEDFPLPSQTVETRFSQLEAAMAQKPLREPPLTKQDANEIARMLNTLQFGEFSFREWENSVQNYTYSAIDAMQSYYRYHNAFDLPLEQSRQALEYPPEDKKDMPETYLAVKPETIRRFTKDCCGLEREPDFSYYERSGYLSGITAIYEDDLLYIKRPSDYFLYVVRRYQYIGNDTYYISCDVDLRNYDDVNNTVLGKEWGDDSKENTELYSDGLRLLVKRADTEWGFMFVQVVQEGGYSLCPYVGLPAYKVR